MKIEKCKRCGRTIRKTMNLDGKWVFIPHYDKNDNVCGASGQEK